MSIAKVLELYARSGRSLIDIGLNEAALPSNVALDALQLFSEQKWCVLGGDVYRLADDRFEPTYEDWFYGGKYVHESVANAREFVSRLEGRAVYVVFVINDS